MSTLGVVGGEVVEGEVVDGEVVGGEVVDGEVVDGKVFSAEVAYAAGMTVTDPASDLTSPADPASRVVRKDVARNRALLMAAAEKVFAERGVDATLDDIARHAGVGVATAYRHFENKQALLAAMFEDRLGKILRMLQDADALADPREAFETFVYGVAAMQSHDRGMREVMRTDHGIDKVSAIRDRVQPIAERIFGRARAAGILRPELTTNDIPTVFWMTGAISDYAGPVSPDLWRRYLDFMLDGMLAESVPRRTISVPALDQEQLETAMHNWHSPRS